MRVLSIIQFMHYQAMTLYRMNMQ